MDESSLCIAMQQGSPLNLNIYVGSVSVNNIIISTAISLITRIQRSYPSVIPSTLADSNNSMFLSHFPKKLNAVASFTLVFKTSQDMQSFLENFSIGLWYSYPEVLHFVAFWIFYFIKHYNIKCRIKTKN